jgi:hypothetical protein
MRAIARLVKWLGAFLRKLGVCGNVGIIIGMLAGTALTLLDLKEGGALVLSNADAVKVWALLVLVCWLAVLFFFKVFVRWPLASVAVPTLVNAVLVVGLTVYLSRALDAYFWAWLIGLLAGMLIGFLLCTFYKRLVRG